MINVMLFLFLALLTPALGIGVQEVTARDQGVIEPKKTSGPEAEARELQSMEASAKYGYIDRTGKMVVPPQHRFTDNFSGGVANIKDNRGMYGYIDKTGRIVIEARFLAAGPFSEGLAPVQVIPETAGRDKGR